MAYEALYRRYRPSTFSEVAGQSHVVAALRNAVEADRVGHAYLFSGPRGTGKTSSARILAKALNCTNLQGGEPCDECESCQNFLAGGSYDLHELDAASNNGVDAMRDLIAKVALGSPGRTKVYILDEVHMLTGGAENALLKTLEEPPPHVVFVLCTTEPNKVVPTIRSRTQHLEFSLLSADEVGGLVDYVVGDAGLELADDDRAYVIRTGGGSARDTLSALDQVVAAGGAPQGGEHLDALFQALIDRNSGVALSSIEAALHAGRDAPTVATALLHELRSVFLATMQADVSHLPEAEQQRAVERAAVMRPARATRAIEVIGASLIEMRQAPDPRVDLEVAVMRLTRPDLDTDVAALTERIESLEHQLRSGVAVAAPAHSAVDAPSNAPESTSADHSAPAGETAEAAAPVQAPSQNEQPPAPREAPVAQQAPAPQPAPAAQQAPAPQPAPAAPQAPASQQGPPRGAAIARAALAQQQGGGADTPPARAPKPAPPEPAPQTSPEAAVEPGVKTLADVRRERQAAAASDAAAPASAGPVAETAAPPSPDAATAAEMPAPAPAPQVAPAPVPEVPPQDAPPSQGPPPQDAPSQEPPSQGPPPDEAPPQHASPQDPEVAPAPVAEAPPQDAPPQEAAPSAGGPPAGAVPNPAALAAAWPGILEATSGRVRSRFSAGRFLDPRPDSLIFGLPNPVHRDRCEEVRAEVDEGLAKQFGAAVPLELVVDTAEVEPNIFDSAPSSASMPDDSLPPDEEPVDLDGLTDAPTASIPNPVDQVMATFEGSTILDDPPPEETY